MKRLTTYLRSGDSLPILFGYWLPELIILFITIALPPLVDAYLIADLHSTTSYGALGMATNFLHTLVKLSEAIPVAAIAIIGRHHGAKNLAASGAHFINTFWTAVLLGCIQLSAIWLFASDIYLWLGVPPAMAVLGAPFLRLRSLSVLLAFILLSLLGFMRAIKNTHTPMLIMLTGSGVYILSTFLLVHGYAGLPACGMYGPAFAALIEYSVMLLLALMYLYRHTVYAPYLRALTWWPIRWPAVWSIIVFSIPVIIDKSALSFSYVWLSKMLAGLGPLSIASFDIVKNLERTAIMPAAAFAQVLTMLVSNHLGAQAAHTARITIFKVLVATSLVVFATLGALSLYAPEVVSLLAPSAEVIAFAWPALRILSICAFFDFVQLILAGALRGAGRVKTVMWTRFLVSSLFFLPISYILSRYPFKNINTQFCLIYASFYVSTACMGVVFLKALSQSSWHEKHK